MFSVILPTYGRQAFLNEAVASVLSQTVRDLELIVVDDASPTPATVPPDPRVRLIRREDNGGVAAARNTALDAAKGRYICFIDDDDLFRPNRLELALEGHRRAPIALCRAPFQGSGGASGDSWMGGCSPRSWTASRRTSERPRSSATRLPGSTNGSSPSKTSNGGCVPRGSRPSSRSKVSGTWSGGTTLPVTGTASQPGSGAVCYSSRSTTSSSASIPERPHSVGAGSVNWPSWRAIGDSLERLTSDRCGSPPASRGSSTSVAPSARHERTSRQLSWRTPDISHFHLYRAIEGPTR